MTDAILDDVEAVRRFGRFYTRQIGLLDEGLLRSPYSLTEARVIYEIAHREGATATDIAAALGLDAGYMSRVLRGLGRRGILHKRRSEQDRRRVFLELSDTGAQAFSKLNADSEQQVRDILTRLDDHRRREVVAAMRTVQETLSTGANGAPERVPFTLRPHRAGDIAWMIEEQAALYAESHGWGAPFEAMCAEIGARFLKGYDPAYERSWVAERGGTRIGGILLVRRSKTVGQLRFLFVDPAARGLGLGARLVSECVGQARHVGYRKMILFTVRGLDSARKLYESEGFELTGEAPGEGWAEGCSEQTWELKL